MSKLYLGLILGLFFLINISFVSSATQIVKVGNSINLKALSNCSIPLNLTEVSSPIETFIINTPMTNLGGQTYNYTFYNTTELGMYSFSWDNACLDCADGVCEDSFIVTNSGTIITNAESILYIVLIIINIGVFLFFAILAFRLPYNNEIDKKGTVTRITKAKYIKLFCMLLSYGSFLWFFGMFTGIVNNFITLDVFRTMITNVYLLLSSLGVVFTFTILTIFFVELWKDILHWQELKKYASSSN